MMVSLGYTLSGEEHPPVALVANRRRAEAAGFHFVSISDHYHPRVSAQGHSPFWTGDTVDHGGQFYEVDNAKLFDRPEIAPPVIVSGFGPKAVELAARIGDGYWGHAPERSVVDRYRGSGGTGPCYAQLNLCWAEDSATARKTVQEMRPNGGVSGHLSQDLPTRSHFEDAATMVSESDATKSVSYHQNDDRGAL